LREKGIEVVLSGGAAVSFYSKDQYVSKDVDLVCVFFPKRTKIIGLMAGKGFHEEGLYFKHPDTQFIVEFPTGPLAVGEEPVNQINQYSLSTGDLRIISPTDCVKDRLLGFFHWDDRQCLSQAVLVTQLNEIDIKEVERWAKGEGTPEKLNEYLYSIES